LRRLIIRPGAIGDCILSLPAMESLCAGAARTEVWVASQNAPLVRFASHVRAIASTGLDLLGIPDREAPAALLDHLASFGSIVSWYGAKRPEFRAAVANLPFRFLDALPPGEPAVHAADFYLRQAGGGPEPATPRIACPAAADGYAVIHPFSGSRRKNWPLERFRELARRLSACMPVHWCAGPEDALDGAVRIENLYELARWLAGARLYIGNDSGITHLAAAAGAPVVALFGPSDPHVWAPRGPRVRVLATLRPGDPIEDIPLTTVWEAGVSLGVV